MKVPTAAELEQMSPQDRRRHFEASIVHSLDEIPVGLRERIARRTQDKIAADEGCRSQERVSPPPTQSRFPPS